MPALRSVAVYLALTALMTDAQPAFQLTVDSIMRGPGLVGYEPRDVRWSGNGERVWFRWKLANDSLRSDLDTYEVSRDGTGLKKLTPEESKLTPPAEGGDTTKDQRLTTYANEGDIYLYDHASGRGRPLTSTNEAESDPHFLGDGKRIAFTRANNLFVLSLDDGSLRQMTDIKPPGTPVPPEETKGTASQEYLKKEERELIPAIKDRALKREEDEARKKKENPRKPFRPTKTQSVSGLRLSPDGTLVTAIISESAEKSKRAIVPSYLTESAYTEAPPTRTKVGDIAETGRLVLIGARDGEVRYVDTGLKRLAPTGAVAQKTETDVPARDRELRFSMPQWSEDGTRAYLTATSEDNKDWWLLALDPVSAKTRVLANVHDDAWVNVRPASGWTQNDSEIYFLSEAGGFMHLYTVPWEGGSLKQLTSGRWEVFDARLSRDKRRFFLESNEEHPGERHLYVMDAAGGPRQKLTARTGRYSAVISPDERSVAFVYSYVNKPPELFVGPLEPKGASVQITKAPLPEFWSYPWQDAPIVAVPARDGVRVPGRLYKPRSGVRGGPAVIFVHGAGYLQNVHKGWSQYFREYMFHHILTERGYTVLDIDYRGSANYGRDWRTAIYRHMGGKDLEDHVDAAKWLVAEQGVDPRRIGIYGGSYGGFITLMAMFRHGDVFAAGAALRPVTDWAHYNQGYTSDILNMPQNDPEAYKRSSPIYFAEGLKGPLLICHGIVDPNVHVQDTIRLSQRLIELRKENWEVALYPVEEHAFVQPASWADEYKRILKLFETNLKPRVQG